MSKSFKLIYDAVSSKKREDLIYWIPERWVNSSKIAVLEKKEGFVRVEPYAYLTVQFNEIMKSFKDGMEYRNSVSNMLQLPFENGKIVDDDARRIQGDWMVGSNIFGMFIRTFTAFDHNLDGELGGDKSDITLNRQGVKETGTFLKAISLLPYIRDMGFNTIYLLPVSMIGKAHKKGELGSPYGLRNPFKIDPIFHDPLVNEFDVAMEFKAFVQAAHIMGFRVVLDFIFRTASRDSDFIKEQPDWFYWINKTADPNYHSPEFTQAELSEIHRKVNAKEKEMPAPHNDYIQLFHEPPAQEDISYISEEEGFVGKKDGKMVVVPGAFADWPPDDIQPAWTDVTYLKLYEDTDFNYVAYNTIRMYDGRIQKENKALWDTLANIIPFYQEEFGLDGARIDMGHALPKKLEKLIIDTARKNDPDFGFLSEDFNVKAPARKAGYNAVFGNFWYSFPRVDHANDKGESFTKAYLVDLPSNPNPVLGTPETADTPRAAMRKGGIKFSKAIWTLVNTLPNMIPFCPAGFELGDKNPTNLGLDFTREEIETLGKKPLGFFDRAALAWDSAYANEVSQVVRKINDFRNSNKGAILHIDNYQWIETEVGGATTLSPKNPVIAYMRVFQEEIISLLTTGIFGEILYPIEIENDYLVVANLDCENEVIATLKLKKEMKFINIFSKDEYKTVNQELNLRLKPGDAIIAFGQ